MKLSELVKNLETIKEEYGDCNLHFRTSGDVLTEYRSMENDTLYLQLAWKRILEMSKRGVDNSISPVLPTSYENRERLHSEEE